jgi:hypothetical protein
MTTISATGGDDPTLLRFDQLIKQGEEIRVTKCVTNKSTIIHLPGRKPELSKVDVLDKDGLLQWKIDAVAFLDHVLPPKSIQRALIVAFNNAATEPADRHHLLMKLRGLRGVYARGEIRTAVIAAPAPKTDALTTLRLLCHRFHAVARQLLVRRNETITKGKKKGEKRQRATLEVKDEYDAQDLMHALLRIYFDDIRPEDPASTLAGAPSRTDFVLGGHGIVLEMKHTRSGLADKEVGAQLIVDTARYRAHPECKTLVCFVYDPNGLISNPVELETSLSGTKDGMPVEVMILPKV